MHIMVSIEPWAAAIFSRNGQENKQPGLSAHSQCGAVIQVTRWQSALLQLPLAVFLLVKAQMLAAFCR